MGYLSGAWGATKDFFGNLGNTLINKPAADQKQGLHNLASDWTQFGKDQRDWYGAQGQGIQGYFDPTQKDINSLKGSNTGSSLDQLWSDATGQPVGGTGAAGDGKTAPGRKAAGIAGFGAPTEAQDYYHQLQTDPSLRPTEQQDVYGYLNGSKDALTNQEELYNERKGGNDPAASYQDSRATDAINRQLAARGGYNTGAGDRQISDYYANANAQRSQQLAGLAAGADTSRLGKNSALEGAAQGASGEQDAYGGRLAGAAQGASKEQSDWNSYLENLGKDRGDQLEKHLNDIIGADQNLASKRADIEEKIVQAGGQALSEAQKESFAASLAELGVDPAKAKEMLDLIGGGASGVIKAAA